MSVRFLAFLVALVAWSLPGVAQEAVLVRTSLKPDSGAVVGQHVRLFVDVLFPGEMPRPPRVEMPEMAGVQIFHFESQATTMNDRIDGRDYVGQRFEFALYARRGGALTVPAARVTLLDREGNETGTLQGKPASVEIAVPAGMDISRPSIASTKVTLDEQWQPAPTTTFKAGDALVRTITRQADDVPGLAMRDFTFPDSPGLRVYVEPPRSDDRVERGALTGRRVDRVTYVFEAGGRFALGGVEQPWWDLDTRRMRQAEGLGVAVSVAAAPVVVPRDWRRPAALVAGLIAVLGFGWWAVPRLLAAWHSRHERWLASEAWAFRALQMACRQNDVGAIYRTFVVWRKRCPRAAVPPALAEELEAVLFAGAAWSSGQSLAFARKAGAARRALRMRRPGRLSAALPPLNPAA